MKKSLFIIILGALSGIYSIQAQTRPVEIKQQTPFFIPDQNGTPYVSIIEVDFFPEGILLNSVSDIIRMKISMEHSCGGDLSVGLKCPNDSMVMLFNHGSLSQGTILGEPRACGLNLGNIDDCTQSDSSLSMGNCYDYYWSPTSSNGKIFDQANLSIPSYYIEAMDSLRTLSRLVYHPVPEIEYQAVDNWNELLNCPMNGEWKLVVTDHIMADNGWVGEWSVLFDIKTEYLLPRNLMIGEITNHSAKLTWLPAVDETGWLVKYKISGTNDPYRKLICSTPDTILTDLIADTLYEVHIKNIWDNDTNIYSLDTTFRTLQTIGITDPDLSRMVTLYPNPVQNSLTVKSDIVFDNIDVLDFLGKVISRKQETGNEIKLDFSPYPSGIYFIRFDTDQGIIVKKIIKK